MYKLYNVKTWGSLAIHCLLEEMEVPYTNIWMTPEQVRDKQEFRAVSPLGMIPALGLSDGRALYNSAAILTFLVTAHPDKHMSPITRQPRLRRVPEPAEPHEHGNVCAWRTSPIIAGDLSGRSRPGRTTLKAKKNARTGGPALGCSLKSGLRPRAPG